MLIDACHSPSFSLLAWAMMWRVFHVFGWIPIGRIGFYLPGFSLQFLLDRVSSASCTKLLEGEWQAAGKHLPLHSTFIREVDKVIYVWIFPVVCVCVHLYKITLLRPFLESWGWKAAWNWAVVITVSSSYCFGRYNVSQAYNIFFYLKRQPRAHSSLKDFPFWMVVSFSKSLGKCCHMFYWNDWLPRKECVEPL